MKITNPLLARTLIIGALSLAGCGNDTSCGEGTVLMDGTCVPTSMVMCGDGTMADADGNCVPDITSCAAGTTLNPTTHVCEPDVTCATGTVAMGGMCVPDGSVICADGTTFDMASGTCVPGDAPCGDGTVLLDGECRPSDEALMADVFAAAEPDDPAFDGAPGTFTPPAVGSTVTIGGCIEPVDRDDDMIADYDADFFTFSVATPGLFRIHADGLGGLAAGFAVLASDGPLARTWTRVGLNLVGDSSERRIYLPRAGNYVLAVFDSRSLNLDSLDRGVGFARAVGGPDACYFVTVEAEATPTPTALPADLTATGNLGDPAFYSATAAADASTYRTTLQEPTNPAAQPAHVLVNGTGEVSSAGLGGFSPPVAMGDDLLVVIDYVYNYAIDDVRYDFAATLLGQVPTDGDVMLTHDADSPADYLAFEADAGDVVHMSFDAGTTSAFFVVIPPNGAAAPCGSRGTTLFGCSSDFYFEVQASGSQIVGIANGGAAPGEMYTVRFTRVHQTPPTLAAGAGMDITLVDDRTFVRADLSSQIWARFTASGFMGAGFTAADVGLHPRPMGAAPLIGAAPDGQAALAGSFSRIYGTEMGEMTLIELTDDGGFDGDEVVNFTYDAETFTDIMTTVGTPTVRTGDAIPAGGSYYLFRTEQFASLSLLVHPQAGVDVAFDVLDETAAVVSTVDAGGVDADETFSMTAVATRWVAIRVDAGATGGAVDLTVTVGPPPYTITPGTTTFSSVCPDMGGSGVYLMGMGADDALSMGADFAAFGSGFMFFGTPVTGFRASTNGWFSFDKTATGFTFTGSSSPDGSFMSPLGTADSLNSLVAPYGDDLDMGSGGVCVLDEAARFIIEWNGAEYLRFGSGAPVQMQVIMLGDSTIEFVYGPMMHTHTSDTGHDVEVGIENAPGTIGIVSDLPTDPGASILFTPTP